MASGKVDQVKGSAKSAVGGATGNRSLQAKGEAQKLKGQAKDKLGVSTKKKKSS